MDRIKEKIEEIEEFLIDLNKYLPEDLDSYTSNALLRAACERIFEKIVEGTIQLTFKIIHQRSLGMPENEKEIFLILERARIITLETSKKLQEAKGMRNILAHEYGKVNDELVYYSLTHEIIPDVEEFLKQIKKAMIL